MSDRMKRKMTGVYFTLVGITLIIIFVLALTVGRYKISVGDFFKMLFGGEGYEIERSVVLNLRLPRTIIAALTGTALSVSGLLYQETFQNRLVSPDLLGVSSGAGVGAALAIVIGTSSVFVSFSAFIFGIFTVLATTFVAKSFKNKSSMALTLSGIIVGGFMGALLSFIKYLADAETTLASITFWLMGSFEQSTMADVYVLLPIVIICSIVILSIGWRVNIVALGREEAQTKGINYRLYRAIIIIVATLLTASSGCFLRYYRLDRAGSAAYSKADGRERYEKSNSHVHAVRGNVYDNSRYFISRVYGCRSSVIGGNGIFRYNRFYCIVICKEGFDS